MMSMEHPTSKPVIVTTLNNNCIQDLGTRPARDQNNDIKKNTEILYIKYNNKLCLFFIQFYVLGISVAV